MNCCGVAHCEHMPNEKEHRQQLCLIHKLFKIKGWKKRSDIFNRFILYTVSLFDMHLKLSSIQRRYWELLCFHRASFDKVNPSLSQKQILIN